MRFFFGRNANTKSDRPCKEGRVHFLFREVPFIFDEMVFHVRLFVYLINAGLTTVLLVYIAKFLVQIAMLVRSAPTVIFGDDSAFMLTIVGLLDQALVMTLLILVIMGGHQIYVRRFKDRKSHDVPQWLDHIDTIFLKVKIGLSFSVISGVLLLKDYMSQTLVPQDVWIRHIVMHGIFVGTTVAFAVVWRLMHPPHQVEWEVAPNNESALNNGANSKNGATGAAADDTKAV